MIFVGDVAIIIAQIYVAIIIEQICGFCKHDWWQLPYACKNCYNLQSSYDKSVVKGTHHRQSLKLVRDLHTPYNIWIHIRISIRGDTCIYR